MRERRKKKDEHPEDRRAPEAVRIIRADEAQAAIDAGHVAARRREDELRFGDKPPAPEGPRPSHRFPLPDTVDPAQAIPRTPLAPLPWRRVERPGAGEARHIDPDAAHDPRPWDERGPESAPGPGAAPAAGDETAAYAVEPSSGEVDPPTGPAATALAAFQPDAAAGEAWEAGAGAVPTHDPQPDADAGVAPPPDAGEATYPSAATWPPAEGGPGYAEADPGYAEAGYAEADPGYAEAGYAEAGYAEADPGYAEAGYAEAGYAEVDPGYAEAGYAEAGYAEADPGYAPTGHAGAELPDHAAPGGTPPGAGQPGWEPSGAWREWQPPAPDAGAWVPPPATSPSEPLASEPGSTAAHPDAWGTPADGRGHDPGWDWPHEVAGVAGGDETDPVLADLQQSRRPPDPSPRREHPAAAAPVDGDHGDDRDSVAAAEGGSMPSHPGNDDPGRDETRLEGSGLDDGFSGPPSRGLTVSGSSPALPHWTDPPTGEVPRVLSDNEPPAADDLHAWRALGSSATRWRGEGADWDDLDDLGDLGSDETRVGAMDPSLSDHSDIYSFDEAFDRLEEERSGAHRALPVDEMDDAEEPFEPEPVGVGGRDNGGERAAAPRPPRQVRSAPPRGGGAGGGAPMAPNGRGDRDLGQAVLVGIGLVVVLIVTYAIGSAALLVFATAIVVAAAVEAYGMLQRAGFRPATLLGLVATAGVMFAGYWKGEGALPLVGAILFLATMLWYLLQIVEARPLANVAVTTMTWMWVGLLGSFAALMLRAPHGRGLFLGAVIPAVAADIVAFFVGRQVGHRPLAPHISPGKTVEGLLAGGVAALVAGAIVGKEVTPWGGIKHGLLLGLVVAVVAPIGDLFESMIKRDLMIKDSGRILPGHGGLLDRFDAILLVLPAAFYLAMYFRVVG